MSSYALILSPLLPLPICTASRLAPCCSRFQDACLGTGMKAPWPAGETQPILPRYHGLAASLMAAAGSAEESSQLDIMEMLLADTSALQVMPLELQSPLLVGSMPSDRCSMLRLSINNRAAASAGTAQNGLHTSAMVLPVMLQLARA